MSARRLVLMRHAEAGHGGGSDLERPLSLTGRSEASSAQGWFSARRVTFDRALVSPARRTRETFELLGTGLEPQLDRGLYLPNETALHESIGTVPDDVDTLLVVSHMPGIGMFALELTDHRRADPEAWQRVSRGSSTATAALFDVELDHWSDLSRAACTLVAVHRPTNHL